MGLLTTGTGLMDYPSRYTKYPRSYTEDAGRALREGISTWAQMYPSYRREQQDYALQQQAAEEKQQEKQRFSQILGKLRQQPLPGMNPAMIDQISMLDPKRGLDTLYNMYSGVKPAPEKYTILSAQEEEKLLGSNLDGVWQRSPTGQVSLVQGSKSPEVKAPDPPKMDKNWAFSILNGVLQSEQGGTEIPPQHHIDTASAILEQGYADPQTGNWVTPPVPPAFARRRSGKRKAAMSTFAGQGLITPRQGQGISHVLTGSGIEYNQDNVKRFLTDNGTVFNPNGSVKTYGPKFDPPQGKMQFPDNMPGLKVMPYNVGALGKDQAEQINVVDATMDVQEQQQFPETLTPQENAQERRKLRIEKEDMLKSRITSKVKGKAVDMVSTNQALLKTLYQMARITYGKSFADELIQRPNAQGEMESLVDEKFPEIAEKEMRDYGITAAEENVGFEIWGETAGTLSMLHKDLFNQIRAAYEFGAPQQAEFDFFDQMIKDPTGWAYINPAARGQFRGQLRAMFAQANSRLKIWDALAKGSGMDPELIGKLRGMKVLAKDENGIDQWDAFTDSSPNQTRNQYREANRYEISEPIDAQDDAWNQHTP